MSILEEEVLVGISSNAGYYEDLGYIIPKKLNKRRELVVERGTFITVKIEDLPSGSGIKLTKICDECGVKIENKQSYSTIINQRNKTDGMDRCKKCGQLYSANERKNNVKYESSLKHWAEKNNKEHLLKEFSDKNFKYPHQIFKSTKDEYLWNCSKCKSEYPMSVDSRTSASRSCNCPYCAGKRVNHTNCLWTTHPEIAKILVDASTGYKITSQSNTRQYFSCQNCNYVDSKFVYSITKMGFSCPKCSDGISYPEKFMFNVLEQLGIDFEPQKTFNWSKSIHSINEKLIGNKRYDFYIPSIKCIVEVHGGQHYNNSYEAISLKSLEDEQENDRLKEKLANENGITNYIIIDCQRSELEYIKNMIMVSDISQLFDLSKIDWLKCHEYACCSLVKSACDLWNNGVKNTKEIAMVLKLNFTTVIKYLKQGTEIGLCSYNSKEVMKNNGRAHKGKKRDKKWGKPVVRLTLDGIYLDEFVSIAEAGRILNISNSHISSACSGTRKTASKFKWMYKEDYENYLEDQKQLVNQ